MPFAIGRVRGHLRAGPANALVAGKMLGAAAGMIVEGVGRDVTGALIGAAAGAAFVACSRFVNGNAVEPHGVDRAAAAITAWLGLGLWLV